jgi:hypothetical protein
MDRGVPGAMNESLSERFAVFGVHSDFHVVIRRPDSYGLRAFMDRITQSHRFGVRPISYLNETKVADSRCDCEVEPH